MIEARPDSTDTAQGRPNPRPPRRPPRTTPTNPDMARLSYHQKAFIVKQLACFDEQSRVVELFKLEFGFDITRQKVDDYRPGRAPRRWAELHDATRAQFLAKVSDIPAANRAVRIHRLERMATRAEARGNFALAAALYEQIARDVGRMFSNRRVSTIKGGAGAPLVVFELDTGGNPALRRTKDDESGNAATARGDNADE